MLDRWRAWWAAWRAEQQALEDRRNAVEDYIADITEGKDPDA